ncbi:MAG: VCBS repeat-containing protein [Verrucomicrobiae bacterium]|nr:VCBS repeat-containing protein [Verrucomicrobiae bacterium]
MNCSRREFFKHGCCGAAAALWFCAFATAAEFPQFKPHEIGRGGKNLSQTSLVDVDKDGDLDWIIGGQNADVWWFEYVGPDNWVRHKLGDKAPTEAGGTAFDVDGDGWIDHVAGAAWYRNTGKPREQEFVKHPNGGMTGAHDNVAADIDGDGKLEVVALWDKQGLFWYKIPADPTQPWIAHWIADGVHGAIGPHGVGDLDGDGDNDIVRTNVWYENKDGKGTKWVEHKDFNFGLTTGRFQFTTRSWVLDLDRDGDNDVVMGECDCDRGRLAWFENQDGKGKGWVRHIIAETDQDLHSLCIADFDGDGDLDIFSGGSGPFSQALPAGSFGRTPMAGAARGRNTPCSPANAVTRPSRATWTAMATLTSAANLGRGTFHSFTWRIF